MERRSLCLKVVVERKDRSRWRGPPGGHAIPSATQSLRRFSLCRDRRPFNPSIGNRPLPFLVHLNASPALFCLLSTIPLAKKPKGHPQPESSALTTIGFHSFCQVNSCRRHYETTWLSGIKSPVLPLMNSDQHHERQCHVQWCSEPRITANDKGTLP